MKQLPITGPLSIENKQLRKLQYYTFYHYNFLRWKTIHSKAKETFIGAADIYI